MTNFLETPEWISLSKEIRIRDKECLRCGSKHRLCADHIIPRRRRRDLSLEKFNLQTLCWQCNTIKKDRYIVSYLKNPTQKLLNEINNEKLKIRLALNKIAKKQIHKKSINKKGLIDEDLLTNFANEYTLITLGIDNPKQKEREGAFHAPLNILRFFGIAFSIFGGLAIALVQEANTQYGKYQITEDEISEYIDKEINKVFSDWDFGLKKERSGDTQYDINDKKNVIKNFPIKSKTIYQSTNFVVIEENANYKIYDRSYNNGFSIVLCEHKSDHIQKYIAYIRNKKWKNIDYIAIEGFNLSLLYEKALDFTNSPNLSEAYVNNNEIKIFNTAEYIEDQSAKAKNLRSMLFLEEEDDSDIVEVIFPEKKTNSYKEMLMKQLNISNDQN
ncbi:MAG: HNH endonuclease [Gammaproteobacteria bacterium]